MSILASSPTSLGMCTLLYSYPHAPIGAVTSSSNNFNSKKWVPGYRLFTCITATSHTVIVQLRDPASTWRSSAITVFIRFPSPQCPPRQSSRGRSDSLGWICHGSFHHDHLRHQNAQSTCVSTDKLHKYHQLGSAARCKKQHHLLSA